MHHFNLGGCQTWGNHDVDVDIAVLNVYNHLLSKKNIESKYNILKNRGSSNTEESEFGPSSIEFSTSLGQVGQIEGCFGTIDAEKRIPFTIQKTTGQLSTSQMLNYEKNQQWGLQIRVKDDGGQKENVIEDTNKNTITSVQGDPLTADRIITINVNDINEKPRFSPTCSIWESKQVLREYDISLRQNDEWLTIIDGNPRSGESPSILQKRSPHSINEYSDDYSTFKVVSGLWDPRGYSIRWKKAESSSTYYLTAGSQTYKYIGCYLDNRRRDLKHGPRRYGYNADTCRSKCLSGRVKYKYFSLQHGGQCFCDSTYSTPSYYRKMPDKHCHRHGGYRNGGAWRNAVFEIIPDNLKTTPTAVLFSRFTNDYSFAKKATWVGVDAIDSATVHGHSTRLSLHTMDDPPLFLTRSYSSNGEFSLVELKKLNTMELRQSAVFEVNEPLSQLTEFTLFTRVWLSNIGTSSRRSSRTCSLQPYSKKITNVKGHGGTVYNKAEIYLVKFNCQDGSTGASMYQYGNYIIGRIGNKKCVLDASFNAGSSNGLLTENEHELFFNCHSKAEGISFDLSSNTRYYGTSIGSDKLNCGVMWDVNFGSFDELNEEETIAKLHCGTSSGIKGLASAMERKELSLNDIYSISSFGQCIAVQENKLVGSEIGDAMSATDDDGTSQELTYAIANAPTGTSSLFSINSQTGQISVLSSSLLNFESQTIPSTIVLSVSVTDNHPITPLMAKKDVLIVIEDVNEPPIVFNDFYAVKENAVPGTELGWSSLTTSNAADTTAGNTVTKSVLLNSRGARVVGSSSQFSSRLAAKFALDSSDKTSWSINAKRTSNQHYLWIDLQSIHAVDKIILNMPEYGPLISKSYNMNIEVQTSDHVLNKISNWWSALDTPNSWAMTDTGYAMSGLYRSKCTSSSCIEQAKSNEGVHGGGSWRRLVTRGDKYDTQESDVGKVAFDKAFASSSFQILHRHCKSCKEMHRNIYYHRVTPMKKDFSIYDTTQITWSSENGNRLGIDFNLYSTLDDALSRKNGWKYCNYNDPSIGFPRDCGSIRYVSHQWQSQTRGGQKDFRWSVYMDDACKEVDFIFGSSSTWNVCPSGYYMTGLHTTGTISIDRMKCCPETTRTTTSTEVDATSFTYKWGRCSYVDWSNSFSARGWSECPDKMQLAGLHTSCTNSISCINQAKCCSYTHTNYETETTYETTIPMKKGVYTLKTSGTCFMFLFIVNYNSSSHYCYFYSNIFIYTHFLQVQRQDNLSK